MNKTVKKVWEQGKCPIIDGVMLHDGTLLLLRLKDEPNGRHLVANGRSTIESFIAERPDELSSLCTLDTVKFLGDELVALCGEGSWGGDGFVALTNAISGELIWIFFSDASNPFVKLNRNGDSLIATNNQDERWCFPIDDPSSVKIFSV